MSFQRPRPLGSGSRIRVIAPSSPFDRARFDAGRALLEGRYEVSLGDALFQRAGFLAGTDAMRLADLDAALADPAIDALIAARGGYGATRLLPQLDVSRVRAAARWLVGFSDVTALHALWARAGLCSLHAPMVCSLPDASDGLQASFYALLEGGQPPPLRHLTVLRPGRAEGRLFGGNLTVLSALAGTPYMPPLDGVVLVLEDVGERPYRLDRMLTSLRAAGCFDRVCAVVVGTFSDCHPGVDGVTADDVIAERLGQLDVPVLTHASFGHVPENTPLLLGAHAIVDGDHGEVSFELR